MMALFIGFTGKTIFHTLATVSASPFHFDLGSLARQCWRPSLLCNDTLGLRPHTSVTTALLRVIHWVCSLALWDASLHAGCGWAACLPRVIAKCQKTEHRSRNTQLLVHVMDSYVVFWVGSSFGATPHRRTCEAVLTLLISFFSWKEE